MFLSRSEEHTSELQSRSLHDALPILLVSLNWQRTDPAAFLLLQNFQTPISYIFPPKIFTNENYFIFIYNILVNHYKNAKMSYHPLFANFLYKCFYQNHFTLYGSIKSTMPVDNGGK